MNVPYYLTIEKVLFILFRSKKDILHIFEQAYLPWEERLLFQKASNICTGRMGAQSSHTP